MIYFKLVESRSLCPLHILEKSMYLLPILSLAVLPPFQPFWYYKKFPKLPNNPPFQMKKSLNVNQKLHFCIVCVKYLIYLISLCFSNYLIINLVDIYKYLLYVVKYMIS